RQEPRTDPIYAGPPLSHRSAQRQKSRQDRAPAEAFPLPALPTRATSSHGAPRPAALRPQPGARRDDQCLDAGLQGRMNDWCKAWIVVRRDLVEPACLLGFRVAVGVGAANEPEHGGCVPFRAERSEILAGWSRPGLKHAVCGKVPTKRI